MVVSSGEVRQEADCNQDEVKKESDGRIKELIPSAAASSVAARYSLAFICRVLFFVFQVPTIFVCLCCQTLGLVMDIFISQLT